LVVAVALGGGSVAAAAGVVAAAAGFLRPVVLDALAVAGMGSAGVRSCVLRLSTHKKG
jgi:hypothetical protein